MPFESVEKLQQVLVENVFHYAKDPREAAGRALGTLIELITFYTLDAWGLRHNTVVERALPEFGGVGISHNVEYTLHPIRSKRSISTPLDALPLTTAKLSRFSDMSGSETFDRKNNCLLTLDGLLRNACVVGESEHALQSVHLSAMTSERRILDLIEVWKKPFAMFECKRVGVEEGMSKGPQAIEKAKQGAYVARHVSALQRVRGHDGIWLGVLPSVNGELLIRPHRELLRSVIEKGTAEQLASFVLTVGVASNHGNWFTAEDHNKELKVLAQSYDWLLFLTDHAITQFVEKLLLSPEPELNAARLAFVGSYTGAKGQNRFTKVRIDHAAHLALHHYFESHSKEMDTWFNVIAPEAMSTGDLRDELVSLAAKPWQEILTP